MRWRRPWQVMHPVRLRLSCIVRGREKALQAHVQRGNSVQFRFCGKRRQMHGPPIDRRRQINDQIGHAVECPNNTQINNLHAVGQHLAGLHAGKQ